MGGNPAAWAGLLGAAEADIAELAFLSDRHGAALVDETGTVVWLCLPRIDHASLCAALPDAVSGGHISVEPDQERARCERRHRDHSLVLWERPDRGIWEWRGGPRHGEGGLLRRYRVDDGRPGEEHPFTACTSWLAECLARQGRRAQAERAFSAAMAVRTPLGLFSEQADPAPGRSWGNVPQALSHLSHIAAVVALNGGG